MPPGGQTVAGKWKFDGTESAPRWVALVTRPHTASSRDVTEVILARKVVNCCRWDGSVSVLDMIIRLHFIYEFFDSFERNCLVFEWLKIRFWFDWTFFDFSRLFIGRFSFDERLLCSVMWSAVGVRAESRGTFGSRHFHRRRGNKAKQKKRENDAGDDTPTQN